MAILLVLIPISLLLVGAAIWAFVWAVRGGQFEDLDAASLDILQDEQPPQRRNSMTDDKRSDDAG